MPGRSARKGRAASAGHPRAARRKAGVCTPGGTGKAPRGGRGPEEAERKVTGREPNWNRQSQYQIPRRIPWHRPGGLHSIRFRSHRQNR